MTTLVSQLTGECGTDMSYERWIVIELDAGADPAVLAPIDFTLPHGAADTVGAAVDELLTALPAPSPG